ncbi:hypothetical protein [Nocardioides sp. GCM10030258]|uniref:hypothetical protein n=1 Tax=unclassified Nocardioides TaxID=2615069 RepID=UPI00360BF5F3
MVIVGVKALFGVAAAVLYTLAGASMLHGATSVPGYLPGEGAEYVITLFGAAMTAFVAAQLGVAIGSPDKDDNDERLGVVARLDARSDLTRGTSRVTIAVLLFDVVVLCAVGLIFVWLYISPSDIEVAKGAKELTKAPDYISLQAKAFIALVVAGAGGVGVAAAK